MNNKNIGNFSLTRSEHLSELNATLFEWTHIPSSASIMFIKNDDSEKVFNLCFQTIPKTSNGVAHVLEHIVLCGSKKYPVKDPFFSMTRQSLNTFMNAFTGSDFTCYPAASKNLKDFNNLLDVYLDSVFQPLITKESFLQEGHRLEFSDENKVPESLIFNGIVYNEMKGAMASPESKLIQNLQSKLFPNTTYATNSGGEPKEILNLTYEDLISFHKTFYAPSKCLFYFYGDLEIEPILEKLEKDVFSNTNLSNTPKEVINLQPRFTQSIRYTDGYPVSEFENLEDKDIFGISWLTTHISNQEDVLALNILEIAIMGTDAAPLKKALLRSDLCKQTDSFLDNDILEVPFSIICKGCKSGSSEEIEKIIFTNLKEIADHGIEQNLVLGAIQRLEMSKKEITCSSLPYGLSLFFRAGILHLHNVDPIIGLQIHDLFRKLKENIQNKDYFKQLITKYFLNNPHFIVQTLTPDKQCLAKELAEEQEKLNQIKPTLSQTQISEIIASMEDDDEDEDLSVLPKFYINDVPKEEEWFELEEEKYNNTTTYRHECFTNGLCYTTNVFSLPQLNKEELPLLSLYSFLLTQVGSGSRSYSEQLEYILLHTGGFSVGIDLCSQAHNNSIMKPSLSIDSIAFDEKVPHIFNLIKDIHEDAHFHDTNRLKELLIQHFEQLSNNIKNNSMKYAMNLSMKGYSSTATTSNFLYGLEYYNFINEIIKNVGNLDSLTNDLLNLHKKIMKPASFDLLFSCSKESYQTIKQANFYSVTSSHNNVSNVWNNFLPASKETSSFYVTSSPVAFTAYALPGVNFDSEDLVSLTVASQIMENNILHNKIREEGGAYGSGANVNSNNGAFCFTAYRDPNIASSLEAFIAAIEHVSEGKFNDEDLTNAKLCVFQDLESPVSPGSRGSLSYFRNRKNKTKEKIQNFRDRLFSLSKSDIQNAVRNNLLNKIKDGVLISFASSELLEKENKKMASEIELKQI